MVVGKMFDYSFRTFCYSDNGKWFFRRDTILEGWRYSKNIIQNHRRCKHSFSASLQTPSLYNTRQVICPAYTTRNLGEAFRILSAESARFFQKGFGWNIIQTLVKELKSISKLLWENINQIQVSEMGFIFLRGDQNETTVLEQLDTSEVRERCIEKKIKKNLQVLILPLHIHTLSKN